MFQPAEACKKCIPQRFLWSICYKAMADLYRIWWRKIILDTLWILIFFFFFKLQEAITHKLPKTPIKERKTFWPAFHFFFFNRSTCCGPGVTFDSKITCVIPHKMSFDAKWSIRHPKCNISQTGQSWCLKKGLDQNNILGEHDNSPFMVNRHSNSFLGST